MWTILDRTLHCDKSTSNKWRNVINLQFPFDHNLLYLFPTISTSSNQHYYKTIYWRNDTFLPFCLIIIHTYLHNFPLQPFSQDLRSGTYSLTSAANDRFFEKLLLGRIYLLSEFLQEVCWEEIYDEIFLFFSYFASWCLSWHTNPGFKSNLPTHYILDYGVYLIINGLCRIKKIVRHNI